MAKGVKHYFKNGKEHKTHTASSKYLVHKKDLSATAKKVANA